MNFLMFRHLWLVDDAAWLQARKGEWGVVRRNGGLGMRVAGREALADLERFFIYGIEASFDSIGNPNIVIDGRDRLLLTPFRTASEAEALFEALSSAEAMKDAMSEFPFSASRAWSGLPWIRERVRAFIQGVIGDRYLEVVRPVSRVFGGASTATAKVSPDRMYWHEKFAHNGMAYLRSELPGDYCYVVDCVPYYLSMLEFMERADEPISDAVRALASESAAAVRSRALSSARGAFAKAIAGGLARTRPGRAPRKYGGNA